MKKPEPFYAADLDGHELEIEVSENPHPRSADPLLEITAGSGWKRVYVDLDRHQAIRLKEYLGEVLEEES